LFAAMLFATTQRRQQPDATIRDFCTMRHRSITFISV
jgi:hypothetical protein